MADPRYRQIAEDLFQKIESGALGRGAQLPTELALREQYDASRNTVRDAVKWLIGRGLVQTRPGQGTFVVEKIDPFVTTLDVASGFGEAVGTDYASEVKARMRVPDVSVPRIEIQQNAGTVASELDLPDNSTIISRHQQRYIDDIPWSLQTSFYPMSFVQEGAVGLIQAEDMRDGVVRYLEQELGIRQAGWLDKITVRAPDANETSFFKLSDDGRVAVFEIRRTAFDDSGNPIRLTVTTYPADRNQFVMHFGKVPPDIQQLHDATLSAEPGSAGSDINGQRQSVVGHEQPIKRQMRAKGSAGKPSRP